MMILLELFIVTYKAYHNLRIMIIVLQSMYGYDTFLCVL